MRDWTTIFSLWFFEENIVCSRSWTRKIYNKVRNHLFLLSFVRCIYAKTDLDVDSCGKNSVVWTTGSNSFHNAMHILFARRVSDYSEDRAYREEAVHPPPSPQFLSHSRTCTHVCTRTRVRDEGVNVRTRRRSSLSRSIWPIRVPSTLLATMRSTWHFRPDEEKHRVRTSFLPRLRSMRK